MISKSQLLLLTGLSVLVSLPAAAEQWRIATVAGQPSLGEPVISFFKDGAVSGSTGCNRFQTSAVVEPGGLVIDGPVATTRMACPGEALTSQEDAVLDLLQGRIDVTYDPFRHEMTLAREGASMTLTAVVSTPGAIGDGPLPHAGLEPPLGDPAYLVSQGPDDLAVAAAPSGDAEEIARLYSGTVMRNEGCVESAGGDWCEVSVPADEIRGWVPAERIEAADAVLRAGQGYFDAAGLLPCAKGAGMPATQCAFGVARDGGGSATVVVIKPDGAERVLFFENGLFVSSDTSQAGGGFESSATREADLNFVRVDDERYEVSDAVVSGG